MKLGTLKLTGIVSALLGALAFAPNLTAECGGYSSAKAIHSSWQLQFTQPRLLETADEVAATEPAGIVGLWHVKFVSKNSHGIPDGTEIDAGYSVWHSDNTEILNSGGRSPLTSNFCLGVWKQTGTNTYALNHFAIAWNDTGSELIGPANIHEYVTLNAAKDYYSGSFTIDQYDESGNKLAHVQGIITATRIDIDTTTHSIF